MKLADRMKLAKRAEAIALAHGVGVMIQPRGISNSDNYTIVRLLWSNLSASFDIGDELEPEVLVHFFGAKYDLRRYARVFDSINESHRRKATTHFIAMDDEFFRWFEAMCEAVSKGYVFEQKETP